MTDTIKGRVPKVAGRECMLLLSQTQCRTHCAQLPYEEKTSGKWGQSLTLTIGVSESKKEDGDKDAVQLEPEPYGQKVMEVVAAEGTTMDTSMQGDEDSLPMPQTNEVGLPADEIELQVVYYYA